MDDQYRKERDHYFIRKFNTFYEGLNRQKQIKEVGDLVLFTHCAQLFNKQQDNQSFEHRARMGFGGYM